MILRRSVSLIDRGMKSDAEDKSLSNDEASVPSCPRQPPDGVETPSDEQEKPPALPLCLPPPPLSNNFSNKTRSSYLLRNQDARSEASVKHKIAMFSNESACLDHSLGCNTIPNKKSNGNNVVNAMYYSRTSEPPTLSRRLTKSHSNLDTAISLSTKPIERPETLGAAQNVSQNAVKYSDKNKGHKKIEKPLFYGSTNILPINTSETLKSPQFYHSRSISEDNSKKLNYKTHLEYLIEQRKKSMSKLRGLLIPESQGPICDLPEIKVKDFITESLVLDKPIVQTYEATSKTQDKNKSKLLNCSQWDTDFTKKDIPKYSPAFKRKSLQVYTPLSYSKDIFRNIHKKKTELNINDPMLDKYNKNVKASKNNSQTICVHDYGNLSQNDKKCKNVEIKICTLTEIVDSDNDSAMSSNQSSYRSSASSPLQNIDSIESDSSILSSKNIMSNNGSQNPADIYDKMITESSIGQKQDLDSNIRRSTSSDTNISLSSSSGSALTSGSQASCSSLESSVADYDKNTVSNFDNEIANRRNIVASAKFRSGCDYNNINLISSQINKITQQTDLQPRNKNNTAIDNRPGHFKVPSVETSSNVLCSKLDSRRRNKHVPETDSDTEDDTIKWQRKSDHKITRVKRNSSVSNKNKQLETSSIIKNLVNEEPKLIPTEILKEIKKAGLEDYKFDENDSSFKLNESKKSSCLLNTYSDKENYEFNKKRTGPPEKINKVESLICISSHKNGNTAKSLKVLRLSKGVSSGVGIVLAGGIDCEAKDVTVHRVLTDSAADKAGLKRGAKIHSINGCKMAGLTHSQSVAVLKERRSEVVIEVEDETQDYTEKTEGDFKDVELVSTEKNETSRLTEESGARPLVSVVVEKAGGGAGLGFGLDGGRDSPLGDKPLTIKKLFAGGAASQTGRVMVGAELVSVGGIPMAELTRTQAWAALKALPPGPVTLILRNPSTSQT